VRLLLADRSMEKEVDALVRAGPGVNEPSLRSPIVGGAVMSWTREATGLATAMKRLTRDG
jgi:hypothetical protein